MTGLEEEFVRRSGGRLEIGAYLREVFRERGKISSVQRDFLQPVSLRAAAAH